jgi:hypothetical protein
MWIPDQDTAKRILCISTHLCGDNTSVLSAVCYDGKHIPLYDSSISDFYIITPLQLL